MVRSLRIALIAAGVLIIILDLFGIGEYAGAPFHGLQHNNLVFLQYEKECPNMDAGLEPGDRITGVDGTGIRNIIHFKHVIRSAEPGVTRIFEFTRGDSVFQHPVRTVSQPDNKLHRKIAMSIVALTFIVVGFYVTVRRPDILGVLFTINCLMFSFLLTERPSTSIPMLHILGEIFYDGMFAFMPAFFLHFFLVFPGREIGKGSRRSKIGRLLYVPPAAIFLTMFVAALMSYS